MHLGELHDRICRTLIAASIAGELLHVPNALAKHWFVGYPFDHIAQYCLT
jgi:hypothetical protein